MTTPFDDHELDEVRRVLGAMEAQAPGAPDLGSSPRQDERPRKPVLVAVGAAALTLAVLLPVAFWLRGAGAPSDGTTTTVDAVGTSAATVSTVPVPTTASTPAASSTSAPDTGWSAPSCDDVPQISAPPGAYADTPIYVANEMPIDEVSTWASTQPGFETVWIDRDHNGWITVAFSREADARQADLEREFPGVGVVAVAVDWTEADLQALQSRITSELNPLLDSFVTWTKADKGVVGIDVGVLTGDIRSVIETMFQGEPICIDGRDPASVPAPGPQPQAGQGWRLLIDEPNVGAPYRTGIATDLDGLETLWATIGLDDPLPEIDFETEVAIWFGAVFSSSCSEIRLDDIVVEGSTVHALIVLPDPPVHCEADARARAYVVAVERSKLPIGPFVIQLDADGPPAGFPEERTVVDADLSQPGAVAAPGQIGSDPNLPEPYVVESGGIIEPGFPVPYQLDTRCGIAWLGNLNGFNWHTDDPEPTGWLQLADEAGAINLSLLLQIEPEPAIEATAGSVSVIYTPTNDPIPDCG